MPFLIFERLYGGAFRALTLDPAADFPYTLVTQKRFIGLPERRGSR